MQFLLQFELVLRGVMFCHEKPSLLRSQKLGVRLKPCFLIKGCLYLAICSGYVRGKIRKIDHFHPLQQIGVFPFSDLCSVFSQKKNEDTSRLLTSASRLLRKMIHLKLIYTVYFAILNKVLTISFPPMYMNSYRDIILYHIYREWLCVQNQPTFAKGTRWSGTCKTSETTRFWFKPVSLDFPPDPPRWIEDFWCLLSAGSQCLLLRMVNSFLLCY